MPHSSPAFVKTVVHHYKPFSKSKSHFFDKAISQVTMYRWFKKLESKASDAPCKPLQRRMRLEVVDELVEIVGRRPYCASTYLVSFLNCWNNTIMGRLKEFGYKNM